MDGISFPTGTSWDVIAILGSDLSSIGWKLWRARGKHVGASQSPARWLAHRENHAGVWAEENKGVFYNAHDMEQF
ncbi:hypothetical protein SAMD00023353_2701400 [Rosellinia necatrix]|uniref:Uncharacterized protein n=1 Tax=Rosellinia necatrix TaxID=77044 RepID=A0A1S8A873_ROSNE|nr:hypothetical protein SAMD00023353_2701400 [Rosellinia necatrix]